MSEVITIGEPLVALCSKEPDVSLVDALEWHKIMGGAELNVAIGVQRLGHSVDYISRIGEDPFGEFVKKTIAGYNIGTQYISYDPDHWTGHQIKQRVTKGDPQVFNYRKNSAACYLSPDVIDKVDLTGVKIAHMSGIFPSISDTAEKSFRRLFARLHENHIMTTYDPNLRDTWKSHDYMVKTENELAGNADIVMPGVNEGKILMGSDDPEKIADFYLQGEYTKTVIVKVGAKGAYLKQKDGHSNFVKGFHVPSKKIVDTVGAGDGFALGTITALLEGHTIDEAVNRGNAVGAMQIQTPGDNDGYPTPEQLQAFYKEHAAD